MTRRWQLLLAALTALIVLVVTIPLAVALPLVMPRDAGVTARRVSGTIWAGTLVETRIAGMSLGDTSVGLSPLALLTLETRLQFATPKLAGKLRAAETTVALADANGTLPLGATLAPLPISAIALEGVTAAFTGDRCVRAEGRVRATLAGDLAGIQLPGGLSGAIRCDGTALVLPLASQTGLERIDYRITRSGSWRAEIMVRADDPVLAGKLAINGFERGPGGWTLRLAGAL